MGSGLRVEKRKVLVDRQFPVFFQFWCYWILVVGLPYHSLDMIMSYEGLEFLSVCGWFQHYLRGYLKEGHSLSLELFHGAQILGRLVYLSLRVDGCCALGNFL